MRNTERLEKRNLAILKKYETLYDVKRKRHDDVIKELADDFFLEPDTVNRKIRKTIREVNKNGETQRGG